MSGWRFLTEVGLVAAGAIAAVIVVDGPSEGGRSPAGPVNVAHRVVGCRERVEGGRMRPKSGRDALIGPVAFYLLPENYAAYARPDPGRSPPEPGFNAHAIHRPQDVVLTRLLRRGCLCTPIARA